MATNNESYNVERREFIKGTAAMGALAGGALTFAPFTGFAQESGSAIMMRPGHYPFKIGEFEGVVLSDGHLVMAPIAGQVVPNGTEEELNPLLERYFLPTDRGLAALNTLVLRAGGKVILFDTGYGGEGAENTGLQMAQLRAAGIAPEDVDHVVITHCHPDHLFGLSGEEGPRFPNADVVMHADEHDFWMNKAGDIEALQGLLKGVKANLAPVKDRIRTLKDGEEVAPGITNVPAKGHTPGHSAFMIENGGEQLLLMADTANHSVIYLANPDYHFSFDMDKPAAAITRRRMLEMAKTDQLRVLGYHFPFPGIGHVAKGHGDEEFRFIPEPWELG